MALFDGLGSMPLHGRQGQTVGVGQHVDMVEAFFSTLSIKFNGVLF